MFSVITYMHVYMITNLVNNKKYIGITTRLNAQSRWIEHKSKALRMLNSKQPISASIQKYGSENFTFEVLETLNDCSIEDLLRKETETIIEYNTLCPNGYNLKLENGFRHLTKGLGKSISKGQQGLKKDKNRRSSDFIGVSAERGNFRCEIAFLRKKNAKMFKLEIDAAKCYDMLAIHFYGKNAKLNFNLSDYSEEQIENNFKNLHKKTLSQYSSQYEFIFFAKDRNKFRVKYKNKYIGQSDTEQGAKLILDKYLEQQNND